MKKKFVIYTAHFGRAGRYRRHEKSLPNVDMIYFTDVENVEAGCNKIIPVGKGRTVKNDIYEIRKMNLDFIKDSPIKRQRFVKICIPDEIFDNYEYSVYLDIKRPHFIDLDYTLSCLEEGTDILLARHRERDCAYKEAEFLLRKGFYDSEAIKRQVAFYRWERFPEHAGLWRSGLIFRRHTTQLKAFSRLWWEQVERFSYRDQISLPYTIWKYDMPFSTFPRRRR